MTEEQQITLDADQQRAVELFCDATFGIITGGPGCGKTTILKQGLQAARERAQQNSKPWPNVALAAPTGKAACRLRDATDHQAHTLHRLLGFGGGESFATRPLDGIDHIVVDEASMVDTPLLAALVNAMDPRYQRLTLVGDANQLPSVGPGKVLADLLDSGRVPTVELKTLHRAAQQSWVCRNAPRILAGELDAIDRTAPDFRFVRTEAGKLISTLLDVFEDELNGLSEILGYDASQSELFDNSQIIVPQRVGTIGADALNIAIQNAVQGEAAVKRGGWRVGETNNFLDGDKIIQTKNDYTLGVMNGESGIVKGSTENGKKLLVRVDDRDVIMDRSQSTTWQLGYAISIHKSQGSQWPLVIVVCHSAQSRMLARRLFYTAVTRASKRVVIIGDDTGFERAVKNTQDIERKTQLGRLLETV